MTQTVKVISYETLAAIAKQTYEKHPTLDTLKTKYQIETKK